MADAAVGCPACGRAPEADAIEVIRLDAEIPVLHTRLQTARTELLAAEGALRDAWQRRNAAAARVRATVAANASPPAAFPPSAAFPAPAVRPPAVAAGAPPYPPASVVPGRPPAPASVPAPGGRNPEVSTRLVQNTLFLLGGVLLGVAAIVFTMVAWAQFGVGGRAVLLAGFTIAALAVPPLVLRRGLTATAETFAALGLLLVLLDGYAAWYVNLFGVAGGSGVRYTGVVCAVTAALAAGYAYLTGLTGPRFVAMLVAQPALPLLVAAANPGVTAASFTLSAVAAGNLAVLLLRRDRFAFTGVAVAAYLLGGAAVAGAALGAFVAMLLPGATFGALVLAGAALATPALLLVAAAILARSPIAQAISGGLVVVVLGIAGVRLAVAVSDEYAPILIAVVVAVLAATVTAVLRLLPEPVRAGPWTGALTVVTLPATIAIAAVPFAAFDTLGAAMPLLHADPGAAVGGPDWQLPAALVVLTAAVTILGAFRTAAVNRSAAIAVPLVGAALVALAAPSGFNLFWWVAPGLDLLVAAAALTLALRRRADPVGALVAAVLGGHAVLVGFGTPGVAVITLAAVAVLALGTAAAAWRRPARTSLGGPALGLGLLTVPAVAWTGALALHLSPQAQARATVAATALLGVAAHLVARRWSGYRNFALAAVLTSALALPVWALTSGDSPAVYAALALIVTAFVAPLRAGTTVVPAALLGAALAFAVVPSVVELLAGPYGWWAQPWSGQPAGTGLDPAGRESVAAADVVAVALFAVAAAIWRATIRGAARRATTVRATIVATGAAAAPALALALPMALAAAGLSWPVVPAASLLTGLICLVVTARQGPRDTIREAGGLHAAPAAPVVPAASAAPVVGVAPVARWSGYDVRAVLAPLGAQLTLAGLSGALPAKAATLVALGLIAVAGVVAGSTGRAAEARIGGWLGATAALLGFAFTVGRAVGLPLASTAFGVAGAAAAVLVLGTLLAMRRRVDEGRAVQAAAHAGAVLALLLTVGHPRHAAALCTIWGLVLGLRALRPGESVRVRRVLVVTAAAAELLAWWLIVASAQVGTVELYSLPGAGVALLAGWLARRTWPGTSSWTAYGVALAAALLPTLAVVVVTDDDAWRRLLLGVGALAVVVAGARARLRAPVVTGGLVLLAVALHELVLVWDRLPRWIPLAAGGLLLVGLAITLERRRRDLARIRAALARMS